VDEAAFLAKFDWLRDFEIAMYTDLQHSSDLRSWQRCGRATTPSASSRPSSTNA
jgi:hypothetical protein